MTLHAIFICLQQTLHTPYPILLHLRVGKVQLITACGDTPLLTLHHTIFDLDCFYRVIHTHTLHTLLYYRLLFTSNKEISKPYGRVGLFWILFTKIHALLSGLTIVNRDFDHRLKNDVGFCFATHGEEQRLRRSFLTDLHSQENILENYFTILALAAS